MTARHSMALLSDPGERMATGAERRISGWRVVAAAWAMAMLVGLGLAGLYLTGRARDARPPGDTFGAVIPRHETACPAPSPATVPEPATCGGSPDAAGLADERAGDHGF